ncbi:MAG: SGNH/GDSL hydrolase family protein [Planctomycetota bacterium]
MPIADTSAYLSDLTGVMQTHWPANRTVNIVCHGHSVPAGYFATPFVNTLNAYPHLLHATLKHRFPYAVMNVIVTAIGGENSVSGAARFEAEVLNHRPDVVMIDYGLNDRGLGLEKAGAAWRGMIAAARKRGARVILMTPTADLTLAPGYAGADQGRMAEHAAQIRALAAEYGTGLVDSSDFLIPIRNRSCFSEKGLALFPTHR